MRPFKRNAFFLAFVVAVLLTTGCQHRRAVCRNGNRPPGNRLTPPPGDFLDDDNNNNGLNNLLNDPFDPNLINRAGNGDPLLGGQPGAPGPEGIGGNPGTGNGNGNDPRSPGGNRESEIFPDRGAPSRHELPDTSAAPSLRAVREVTSAARGYTRPLDSSTH